MSSQEPIQDVHPPHLCETWKSAYAQRLTSKKTGEEFDYFVRAFQSESGLRGPDALLYALAHAYNMTKADDLRNDDKQVTELPKGSKLCIVGAGMAGMYLTQPFNNRINWMKGLYIAMILDELNIPNLSYDILEGSKRIGGRVYTHYFCPLKDKPHDYYDVGAMRFPKVKIMKKTFKLFEHLKTPLIPYYMNSQNENQPSRYNDKTMIGKGTGDADYFKVSDANGGRIMEELVSNPTKYHTETFEPFKERLRKNWSKGFQALMKYDQYSVRGFMMSHGITPLDDYYSIQWLETLTDGSGLYDQAFAEGVIDDLDFDYYSEYINPSKKVEWRCVDGGTQLVPDKMNSMLKKPLEEGDLGKRVTKIAFHRKDDKHPGDGDTHLSVKVDGEEGMRRYMTVFATPTLACLQRIDLTDLELLYEQKDAIRSLHYDTASKVGMKFEYAWWIKYGIKGGLGKTDMPLRCCVYPSYNLNDPHIDEPKGGPAVLLCSYSWSQDAARIGSLMKGDPCKETELKQLLLNNLTWLHLDNARLYDAGMTFDKLYKEISDAYITHHAFDWHNHEWSSGAYGKFGPGQFSNIYTALSCPTADSRFHFVGEAVSAHHGWIVGALDSAHQAVINFLRRFNLVEYEEKLSKIRWLGPPPDEITKETAVKRVVLGLLTPEKRLQARREVEMGKGAE